MYPGALSIIIRHYYILCTSEYRSYDWHSLEVGYGLRRQRLRRWHSCVSLANMYPFSLTRKTDTEWSTLRESSATTPPTPPVSIDVTEGSKDLALTSLRRFDCGKRYDPVQLSKTCIRASFPLILHLISNPYQSREKQTNLSQNKLSGRAAFPPVSQSTGQCTNR